MNICIVTHTVTKRDGQGRVNYAVAKEAAAQGHRVTLLCASVDGDLLSSPCISWVPISSGSLPSRLVRNQIFAVRTARWLKRNAKAFDVIKGNGFITWFPCDINAVHFVHSAWLRSPVNKFKLFFGPRSIYHWIYSVVNAMLEKRAFSQARMVVAVSNMVKTELISIGVPSKKMHVIMNGVDTIEFSPRQGSREAMGLPSDVPIALFVGDVRTPRKNLDTVLKAVQQIPQLHLVVIGDTTGSVYPRMAEALGLNNRVHFMGFRNDVSGWMNTADVFVFPSRYEPCGLVVLEAMASGLPVITAITAGGSEVVTNEAGFVLNNPDSVDDLVHRLLGVISDTAKCENMGRKGREIAQKYTWEAQADKYIKLMEFLKAKRDDPRLV